jgi:flagellar export protein FliJ
MIRSKRIQPVSRIAGRAEQRAAMLLAKNRGQLHELQNRLNVMKAYRRDYERKRGETGAFSVMHLKQNQNFLQQLDEAITILEKQVDRQTDITRQEQQKWIETWKNMNSLNKCIENLQGHELRETERREQDLLDEQSAHSTLAGSLSRTR